MVNLEYLKRSKDEIKKSMKIFNSLNQNNISNMLFHMQNSMLYLVDSIYGKHADVVNDYALIKEKMQNFLDNDFFENYFLIHNMSRKEIKFISPKNLTIIGKKPYQLNKNYFKELIIKLITYFNNVYLKVENNGI